MQDSSGNNWRGWAASHSSNSTSASRRLQVVCNYAVRPRRFSIRAGKYKIRLTWVNGPRLVRQEEFGKVRVKRQRGLRSFRLCLIDFAVCNASLYLDC